MSLINSNNIFFLFVVLGIELKACVHYGSALSVELQSQSFLLESSGKSVTLQRILLKSSGLLGSIL
jgi:hypothetical protein